jgi:hypothetical protein
MRDGMPKCRRAPGDQASRKVLHQQGLVTPPFLPAVKLAQKTEQLPIIRVAVDARLLARSRASSRARPQALRNRRIG